MGKYSPQALRTLRTLINALSKQGKSVEAEEFVAQASASIENLAGTQFTKYQQDKRNALDKVVAHLKG
ncbi:uncharacterized protein BDV17DRAFT_276489 [Aspergillus undulatus]|uniref:uncharacterized protein n=1 Tax=Aspergillus undulatus TaxID=1810928 RepID=UPI003CCD196C